MRIEARGGPRPHATGLGRLGVTRRPHGAVVQNTPRGIVVAVSRPATSTTAAGWAGSARVIDGELVIGPALRAYVRAEGADELALRAELLALLAVRGVVAR